MGAGDKAAEVYRATYGIIVAVIGLVTLLGALLIVLWRVDVNAEGGIEGAGVILGLILSPVVSICAAYFGIAISAESANKASQAAGAAAESAKQVANMTGGTGTGAAGVGGSN